LDVSDAWSAEFVFVTLCSWGRMRHGSRSARRGICGLNRQLVRQSAATTNYDELRHGMHSPRVPPCDVRPLLSSAFLLFLPADGGS
jgi:hypothetical protein